MNRYAPDLGPPGTLDRYLLAGDADGLLAAIVRLVREAAPPWHADAACLEHGEIDCFPDDGAAAAQKAICATCLVRDECAEAGRDEVAGIWGGLNASERRQRADVVKGGQRTVHPPSRAVGRPQPGTRGRKPGRRSFSGRR